MAVSITWYLSGAAKAFNKEVDWNTDVIRGMLVGAGYAFNQDTHDYIDDVRAQEIAAGGGYATDGVQLTTPTVTIDTATNKIKFDSDDFVIDPATLTASGLVIYVDTGVDSTSAVLLYVNFDGAKTATANEFRVTPSSDGWATATVAA